MFEGTLGLVLQMSAPPSSPPVVVQAAVGGRRPLAPYPLEAGSPTDSLSPLAFSSPVRDPSESRPSVSRSAPAPAPPPARRGDVDVHSAPEHGGGEVGHAGPHFTWEGSFAEGDHACETDCAAWRTLLNK